MTDDQKAASVAGHELFHATNEFDQKEIKAGREIEKEDEMHEPAYETGTRMAKEYGEKNKKNE